MMGRMMKLLRSFPQFFQDYTIRRRRSSNKKRNSRINDGEDSSPTLHLPPVSRSKSTAGTFNNYGKNQPSIRIRRARSVKPNDKQNSLKMFSASETNLSHETFSGQNQNGSSRLNISGSKNNGLSASTNNLNITNNNSITNKNNYNYKDGGEKSQKSFWKGSESKKKVKGFESKSDVPRIVTEVIISEAAKTNNPGRIRLERQLIRLINGADPSVQSQVLLNTKTSQPWENLVADLGMAVRLPHSRKVGNRLETLYGRQVRSYSQLRSELKVGNNTFYIYVDMNDEDDDYHSSLLPNLQRQRLSVTPDTTTTNYYRVKRSASNVSASDRNSKLGLEKTLSNSSSDLSTTFSSTRYLDIPNEGYGRSTGSHKPRRHNRRRSQANSPTNISPANSTFHLPQIENNARERTATRKSPSPNMTYNHHPLNFMESRTVHFKN